MAVQLQKLVLEEGCGVALGIGQNLYLSVNSYSTSYFNNVHQGYRVLFNPQPHDIAIYTIMGEEPPNQKFQCSPGLQLFFVCFI